MAELPIMDMAVVSLIKKSMEDIKNDIDAYANADRITDLVEDNRLAEKKAYKPLLQSFCDLLREKGYPRTADFLMKQWRLE